MSGTATAIDSNGSVARGAISTLVCDPLSQTPHYSAALVEHLALLGCDAWLWVSQRPGRSQSYGKLGGRVVTPAWLGRVNRLSWLGGSVRVVRGLAYLADLMSLPRIARAYDVLHLQWLVLLSWSALEVRIVESLRARGVPVVITAHNVEPHEGAGPGEMGRLKRLYASVSAILVHAGSLREELLRQFGVEGGKVYVVPLGPMHRPLRARRPMRESRARVEAPLLLQFGVIRPYKGIEVLLRAMPVIRSRFPKVRLLVVGRPLGNSSHGLLSLHQELHLGDCCRLCFDFVPDAELEDLIDQADLAVFPYLHASQSAAVVSAMSRACPVVASGVGGIPELIRDGIDGYLVQPGDPRALADRVIQALEDPAREQIGKSGQERVFRDFSWFEAARRTVEVYRTVIANARSGSAQLELRGR